jgi:hypothetical protein
VQRELLDQAARSAKAAESSNANVRASERAYLSLTFVRVADLELRQRGAFKVIALNGGRTPALNPRIVSCGELHIARVDLEMAHKSALWTCNNRPAKNAVTLEPGHQIDQELITIASDEWDGIASGATTFRLFAMAEYTDIFGTLHHENVCAELRPDLKTIEPCWTFNNSD